MSGATGTGRWSRLGQGLGTFFTAAAPVLSAVAAAVSAFYAYRSSETSRMQTEISSHQTAAQRTLETARAVSDLTNESTALFTQFNDVSGPGITDVPKLTSFFYVLTQYHEYKLIPAPFFESQLVMWCPRTRAAHAKLTDA
jgi:hypothetical protein